MSKTARRNTGIFCGLLIGLIVFFGSFPELIASDKALNKASYPNVSDKYAKDLREDLIAAGIKKCRTINNKKYVTGLLFNGPGMQTYYERSNCFRELAMRERDKAFCALVIERRSLFFDGSQVTPLVCERKVAEKIQADKNKARMLESQRGRIIDFAQVVGILEYDKVTAARSLILRGKFEQMDWPYYQYDVEFQGQQGEVLTRYTKSPFGQNEADQLFMFHVRTLTKKLAEHSLEDISAIVIRAVLQRHARSAYVMDYIKVDQLDAANVDDSDYGSIPFMGTIRHDQWTDLLTSEQEGTARFLQQLEKLVAQ